MKKWECTVCGYIHEGEKPPAKCPVCGSPASSFKLLAEKGNNEANRIQNALMARMRSTAAKQPTN